MKKLITICVVCLSITLAGVARASITIDFEDFPGGPFASYTKSGVTFTASGGGGAIMNLTTPNGTLGLLDMHTPHKELRADISGGATYVAVDLGDYDADSDRLFLEVFDASNNSLGFTDLTIPGSFTGMETLSLSASNISYAIFGARDAVNGSSVCADNFTFATGTVIPAPGAVLLGSIGVSLVGWLRRRRTL